MKVKVIDQYYGDDLQEKINEFIGNEYEVERVVDIKFSTVWTELGEVITSALIMYEQ